MTKKKKEKPYKPFKALRVWTNGVPGDTCPKRGGQPLKLGDGQCAGEKRCKYFLGIGYFVTKKCAHPAATYSDLAQGELEC